MATIALETLLSLESVSDLKKGPHQRQITHIYIFIY